MGAAADRKEQELAHKRKQIAQAAARVFAKEGYANASMQQIASEAGYAAPTLYSYFKGGKREILEGIMEDVKEQYTSIFEMWQPDGLTLRQRMEMLIRNTMRWFGENMELLTLLSNPVTMSQFNTDQNHKHMGIQLSVSLWEDWFKRQEDLSQLCGHAPRGVAWMLWGLSQTYMHYALIEEDDPLHEDKASHMLEFLFKGLEGTTPHDATDI
jgi:AcrR family transcriptional regulator